MRLSSILVGSAVLVVALGSVAPLTGQTFAASTGTEPVIGAVPPAGPTRLTVPGHHSRAEELIYARVRDGVYTVDGMVAKVQLNYDVDGARFLYMFVPGVGTAVLSPVPEKGAVNTEAVLNDNELSFTVGEHRFKLTGVALAGEKASGRTHLYAKLDRTAWQLSRRPMVGFGDAAAMPYTWPGALAAGSPASAAEESQVVPPVPVSLLPSRVAVQPKVAATPVEPAALQPVAMR